MDIGGPNPIQILKGSGGGCGDGGGGGFSCWGGCGGGGANGCGVGGQEKNHHHKYQHCYHYQLPKYHHLAYNNLNYS